MSHTDNSMDFELQIVGSWREIEPNDDNVDVYVTLGDGRKFTATFFTMKNIESLFRKNEGTGECGKGLYLWAADMVIVKRLSEEVVKQAVRELLAVGEFESAFQGPLKT